ncbi:MAG: PAS domain-containing protein [Desulfobacteraceae bacterium]|nr:MAG: PAS domain-containing protein [Desulfobacteraceae bacterium]
MVKSPSIINIALIGGGTFCKDFLTKSAFEYRHEIDAKIIAVADPNPNAPGMIMARKIGLTTETDYHRFYSPEYDLQLLILMTPETAILEDVLATKPGNIRLLSFQTFEILWTAISIEEKKLRDRTKEIETIIDGIRDFILVLTPDMKVVEVNQAFLQKTGYSRKNVIGKKCFQIYHKIDHPCDESEMHCPLKDVIRNKHQIRQIQTRMMPNNEKRYYEVNIYPIWEKNGEISKFIHISKDITEHKQEEAEITRRLEAMVDDRTRQLKETHEKLLHQDKMASLGKLAASVVHEINNPIAGILNLILLMKRIMEEGFTPKDAGRFQDYLTLMETETRRTSRIVSNLLTFSRQSKMELKKVDINKLVEKTLFLNSNLLKIDNATIDTRLDPDLPKIIGSEDQILQVFMNIISNATEAIEAMGGGHLHVETLHSLKDNTVKTIFTDTGSGIPRENLTKLFEPFFTTKKKGKGVGLGLSVAYGIIQEHGGNIYVESSKGKGTSFTIELPIESKFTQQI